MRIKKENVFIGADILFGFDSSISANLVWLGYLSRMPKISTGLYMLDVFFSNASRLIL